MTLQALEIGSQAGDSQADVVPHSAGHGLSEITASGSQGEKQFGGNSYRFGTHNDPFAFAVMKVPACANLCEGHHRPPTF